ncbi:MAG: uracil-DNA glycosylase [bacterium]
MLRELCEKAQSCARCGLSEARTNVVFGEGSSTAGLMFIGEGPGRDEDAQGRPFVGRAGKLLTQMIEEMGMTREEVYIANIVKCRPPGNREPAPEEAIACRDYLMAQIAFIQPKIVCALGRVALVNLIPQEIAMNKAHGKAISWKGMHLMPVYHPAAALRSSNLKRTLEADFRELRKLVEKTNV